MKLRILLSVTTFLFFFSINGYSQATPSSENNISNQSTQSEIVKKTYQLQGFKQSCCAGIVTYSLKEVDGFIKAEPNIKQQEMTVWYYKHECTEAEIQAAINKTAYKIIDKKNDKN